MNSSVAVRAMDSVVAVEHSEIMNVTVIDRFAEFLDVSAITLRAYRSGIKQFMTYLNSQNVRMPSRESVVMFKKVLIAEGRKPSTVAMYLSSLRRFFAWCEAEGICENITAGVKSPKQDKGHKRDALTGTQIRSCVEGINRSTLQGKRDYAAFLLMATCGLRTIEVSRANVGDLQEMEEQPVLLVHGKGCGEANKFVKLSAPVLQALSEYLSDRGQVQEDAPLFASCSRRNKGGRLTTRTVSAIAKQAMIHAGYNSRRLTAHSLRHSAATLAIDAGMPLQEVCEFMRHSDISVTMVYVHTRARLKSQCEDAVTASIFGAAA